jgi:hypothetical protein
LDTVYQRLNANEGNALVVLANNNFITPFFIHLKEDDLYSLEALRALPEHQVSLFSLVPLFRKGRIRAVL